MCAEVDSQPLSDLKETVDVSHSSHTDRVPCRDFLDSLCYWLNESLLLKISQGLLLVFLAHHADADRDRQWVCTSATHVIASIDSEESERDACRINTGSCLERHSNYGTYVV